ncbi:MAG TPA: response regulator transcription factor [Thermomicrobiales bacterium]
MDRLRILIVEDHPLFRKGLRELIAAVADFELVGEAADGEEAVTTALDLLPDLVLMDLQLPGQSGIEAIRAIVAASPTTRILVVTLFQDDDSVFAALRAGARGYILKDADEVDMIRAIRAIAAGESLFSPAVASRVLAFFAGVRPTAPQIFPTLTDREHDILHLLARGKSNAAIATELGLSPKTIANNVSNIFGKLQVADRSEAIVRAREAGLG